MDELNGCEMYSGRVQWNCVDEVEVVDLCGLPYASLSFTSNA